jgi:hypothetical protein
VVDRLIKTQLGFEADAPDDEVMRIWKEASTRVCKPCWELKYCPYGPLVEDSPLLPPTRAMAQDHHEYLKKTLETGVTGIGEPLDDVRRRWVEKQVADFNLTDYPEEIPREIADMQCTVFGHICPVVFNAAAKTAFVERGLA